MRTTLALCKIMGMSYDDIRALPQAVYELLIEDVLARQQDREALV